MWRVCWVASLRAPGASSQTECDSVTFSLHFPIASRCLRSVCTFMVVCDRRQVTRTSKRKGCRSWKKIHTHASGTWIWGSGGGCCSGLTLNIPSLARQRCLSSWGPRRTPWFFCNFSTVWCGRLLKLCFLGFWNYNSVIQALLASNILCLFISTEVSQ